MNVTIVTAFLMKKYRISANEALNQIMAQKWNIRPHKHFLQHLKLWEYMGFRLKSDEPLLRRALIDWFRFELQSIVFEKDSNIEEMRKNFLLFCIKYCEINDRIKEKDGNVIKGEDYHCIKCDKEVFSTVNTIKNQVAFHCKYIYIEPIRVFLGIAYKYAMEARNLVCGPIHCQSCEQRIGLFDWFPNTVCKCPLHIGLDRYLIFKFFAEKLKLKEI